jgi:hypothetical protein
MNHYGTWRQISIPKPGKKGYHERKAYRVIALQNCLGKVVGKVVQQRYQRNAKAKGYNTMANSDADKEGWQQMLLYV